MRGASEVALEAARYALVRRLAPVLRHHMVVHLQPIGMIYEVLDRKLALDAPDLPVVREGLGKIRNLARSAVTSCLDVMGWIAPEADSAASVDIDSGVADCADLLRSSLMFRGFTLDNQVGGSTPRVSRIALREVLTAAILATADAAEAPAELILGASPSNANALLSVTMLETGSEAGKGSVFATDMAYRPLRWGDVACLAREHGVHVTFDPAGVQLVFASAM